MMPRVTMSLRTIVWNLISPGQEATFGKLKLSRNQALVNEKNEIRTGTHLKFLPKLFKSITFCLIVEALMGILARAMVTIGIERVLLIAG